MKDWTGNKQSTFATLGASNHSDNTREEHDFYATDPQSLRIFLNEYLKDNTLSNKIWEPACGLGHLSKVLEEYGFEVKSTDLVERNFGMGGGRFPSRDRKNRYGYSNQPTV